MPKFLAVFDRVRAVVLPTVDCFPMFAPTKVETPTGRSERFLFKGPVAGRFRRRFPAFAQCRRGAGVFIAAGRGHSRLNGRA